jgi:hypothetical protein
MSYFPIARANKWRYTPAGTSGCEWEKVFEIKQMAIGSWQLAKFGVLRQFGSFTPVAPLVQDDV